MVLVRTEKMRFRTKTPRTPGSDTRLRVVALIAAGIVAAAILALGVLLYRMPESFSSGWGINYPGVQHFQRCLLGKHVSQMPKCTFLWCFRLLLGAAWSSYALAVALGLRGHLPSQKYTLCLVLLTAILLAVFWPAALSNDSYAYAAYARVQVLGGANPYLHTPQSLRALGEPSAAFLRQNIPSYGPVWMLLTIAVVRLLRSGGLWWHVVGIKLFGAAALIIAALAGRRVAEDFSPGRGSLTLMAIGLNPLFLIEGPGSGHDDLMMMSLLLVSSALYLRKRHYLSGLFLGLSVGIKFVTAAVVPWMVLEHFRGRRSGSRPLLVAATVVLALAPTVLGYLPFWQGIATFESLRGRSEWSQTLSITQEASGANRSPSGQAVRGLIARPASPLVASFLILSALLWFRRTDGEWMTAWVIFAGLLVIVLTGIWFPWYFIWPWSMALTRWDRVHLNLSQLCLGISVLLTMMYTVVW